MSILSSNYNGGAGETSLEYDDEATVPNPAALLPEQPDAILPDPEEEVVKEPTEETPDNTPGESTDDAVETDPPVEA